MTLKRHTYFQKMKRLTFTTDNVDMAETLCIPNFVLPQRSVVIFLDMDGVLIDRNRLNELARQTLHQLYGEPQRNSNGGLKGNSGYTELEWRTAYNHHLDQDALQNFRSLLSKIKERAPVYIVLSSSWREDGSLSQIRDQMFGMHDFGQMIIGKTPHDDLHKDRKYYREYAKEKYNMKLIDRGSEIDFWLKEYATKDTNFVVLDDVSIDRFEDRFVWVCSSGLLNAEDVKKTLDILFK
jgi:hypothetical protein